VESRADARLAMQNLVYYTIISFFHGGNTKCKVNLDITEVGGCISGDVCINEEKTALWLGRVSGLACLEVIRVSLGGRGWFGVFDYRA
jgi:hypothetical protein